jgi:hypothetical protein
MKKAKRIDTWPFQILGGEVVIVVPPRREIHRLNEVGSFLWQELARETAVAGLAERVTEEFDVTPDEARADVERFLADMKERELVELS